MKTWHAFAFLIAAVAYYYASGPILFIAATVIGVERVSVEQEVGGSSPPNCTNENNRLVR